MTHPNQIPHLIKLLDDDSSEVQEKVFKELAAFGPILKDELQKLSFVPNPIQFKHLKQILTVQKKTSFKREWLSWFPMKEGYEKLERALCGLAYLLGDFETKDRASQMLDELAGDYRRRHRLPDERSLSQFLFKEKGFHGDSTDYYNPQNSNLIYVLGNKKGVPISLSCVYMLIGSRFDLNILGCSYPGHFLTKIIVNGKRMFVDCFNSGQLIEEDDIARLMGDDVDQLNNTLNINADTETIVKRFLANLVHSYQLQKDEENGRFVIDLLKDLDLMIFHRTASFLKPESIISPRVPAFKVGQTVKHKRYGYQGIIVDVDSYCKAPDSWYYTHQVHSLPDDPWYHILIHNSDQVSYVSESNLSKEPLLRKVSHPLVSYFFDRKHDGHYLRNENPWPGPEF